MDDFSSSPTNQRLQELFHNIKKEGHGLLSLFQNMSLGNSAVFRAFVMHFKFVNAGSSGQE